MATLRTGLRVAQPLRASTRNLAPRASIRSSVRHYSSPAPGSPPPPQPSGSSSTSKVLLTSVAIAAAAGGAFLAFGRDDKKSILGVGADGANKLQGSKGSVGPATTSAHSKADYQAVYNAIAEELESNPEYDDGSYGPVLVRLAWHASGTYDKHSNTGGSNGATMRFAPESEHGANAGLGAARDFMEKIHKKFPWITYSDLWTLGGVAAVQELGGPKIPWRPGRKDATADKCTPDGRLPDGDKGQDHLRYIFYKMGFNDQEIVALSGAHALGRCHTDRSGFEGPWTFAPTSFTNEYFNLLMNEKWNIRKWNGPPQFEDKSTKSLMMLMTDMALVQDPSFKKHVQRYAKSEDEFFNDFRSAYAKLLELGVPAENFKAFETKLDGGRPFEFATSAEQENTN
ncbi:Cytochrome c peroxidase, mitochondrial [Pseudozyma hubeiensis]|nr:Cytochrome c peroxidase, mitochondrial [Pseudozyma hubeiensis]